MSDFNVSCPDCSQLIICNESHRGTQIVCPHCSKNLVINSSPPKIQIPKIQNVRNCPEIIQINCPHCIQDINVGIRYYEKN